MTQGLWYRQRPFRKEHSLNGTISDVVLLAGERGRGTCEELAAL